MKKCNKCLVVKDVSEFSKQSSRKDGLQDQCKVCKKKQADKWRQDNPDYLTTYWNTHKEVRKKQRIANKIYKAKIKGVYGIFENGECLYIGRSNVFNSRKTNHHHFFNNPQKSQNKWWEDFYTKLNQNHKHSIQELLSYRNLNTSYSTLHVLREGNMPQDVSVKD